MHLAAEDLNQQAPLEIVRLRPDDWAVWRSLRLDALRDAPHAFSSKLAEWQGAGDLEARWRLRLTQVPFNVIGRFNSDPVGMVSATAPDENYTVELISMFVAANGRGHGVGDALVESVVTWARTQRALNVSLEVVEGNQYAARLYARHGFVRAGVPRPDPPTGLIEQRYIKNL